MDIIAVSMSKESKVISRNVVLTLSIIIIILVALLSLSYYNFTSLINTKDAQISSLTSEVASLTNEKNNLQNQLNSLNNEKTKLQEEINNLTNEKKALEDKITSLQNQITALQGEINELKAIINLQKNTILEKDKTVNLPTRHYITLQYNTPYTGYIRITFTASGGVLFWVGNSFTGEYYYRYPSNATTAVSGSFIVPILPGITYIYIENPAWLSGVTVTLTIEYTY